MQNILGQGGENKYVEKIKRKLADGKYPEHVRQAIQCELQNILDLGDGNPEINKKKYILINLKALHQLTDRLPIRNQDQRTVRYRKCKINPRRRPLRHEKSQTENSRIHGCL